MASPGLNQTLSTDDSTEQSPTWTDQHPAATCPAWCALKFDRDSEPGHVAHRAAIWELPDRVELCVMQVVSDDPKDKGAAPRPILYFWSADRAEFSDAECAEMACAIRRAGELLCRINGV